MHFQFPKITRFGGAVIVVAIMLASIWPAHAGEIKWSVYMQSAANVAAIASAVALVDGCSKPLKIEETVDKHKRQLAFTCPGGEDEEGTAIIEFESFGDGVLVPSKFSIAG